MIKIKNISVKNFLSVGNATQAVDFDRQDLTLVLGENLDLGGDGSRNGTGKTTIINALSYALFGQALTNIRKDNLINKTNGKNMLVLSLVLTVKTTELNVVVSPMC
jgi:DNA repair exonuclease SbcCD ATPase subunit